MYGLMIESLDDERRRAEVGEALAPVGFERVAGDVYLCIEPRRTEMLVVHDAIEALRKLPWITEAASKVVAFKVDSWGDITNAIKE